LLATSFAVIVWVFAGALAAATLLPMSASQAWWVRMWDFPRVHIAAGFVLLAVIALFMPGASRLILLAVAVSGAAYQLWRIRPYTPFARNEMGFAPPSDDAVTLFTANVLMENEEHDRLIALVDRVDPDVLFLMETDDRWLAALEPVLARYPSVLREPRDNHYGLVFATRLEMTEGRVVYLTPDDTPTLLAEMKAPNGRSFRFIGLHPQPPVPGEDTEERDAQITYAARFARKTSVPIVAMGDFNEAAWSDRAQHFKRVGRYVDPRIGRGLYASFNANHPMIRCPIDQIYVTEDVAMVSIDLMERFGSDHLPLRACIRLEPDLAARLNRPRGSGRPATGRAPRPPRRGRNRRRARRGAAPARCLPRRRRAGLRARPGRGSAPRRRRAAASRSARRPRPRLRSRCRTLSCAHPLARVVAVGLAPAAEERLEVAVHTWRRDDAQPHPLFAAPLAALHAAPAQPQDLARAGAFRHGQVHRPVDGRRLDLAAEHRLVERDRQVDLDVVAGAAERRMRRDGDRHERVARRSLADARAALAAQADGLAVVDALRDGHVERAAAGQHDALGRAVDRVEKADLEPELQVRSAHREAAATRAAARTAAGRRARAPNRSEKTSPRSKSSKPRVE
jgi:endonuclease/exonuclease/phosphatase (EEP) superfamily protein YafD